MPWNWELPDWPQFSYDAVPIIQKERQFLISVGSACAHLKNIGEQEYHQFVVEILSEEGIESSRIEGEVLDRESLQSSIKKHFGLTPLRGQDTKKESAMASLLCSVYKTFEEPLSHEMLWNWHASLFADSPSLEERGKYRTHPEPMQIVSRRLDRSQAFFEAPPSHQIPLEMTGFLNWFNSSRSSPILERAALAHVYFESIHPFEDGNGRLGRVLVEKILSQGIERPILIAVSKILEKNKKQYYAALETCNRSLKADHWMNFFTDSILQAQYESLRLLYFLIEKSKLLARLSGKLNPRQEKVLLRMFSEGPSGFKGGLSAENYIALTKTSRATATRDLADLVTQGALKKTGELRHTRYWLNTGDRESF